MRRQLQNQIQIHARKLAGLIQVQARSQWRRLVSNARWRVGAAAVLVAALFAAGLTLALTQGSGPAPGARQVAAARPLPPVRLVSSSPAAAATGISGAAAITVVFSAPLAADSPMPVISPAVAGSWQGMGTATLRFVPAEPVAQDTRVTVTIPGGRRGVHSAAGGVLAGPDTLSYVTGDYQPGRLDQLLAQLGYLPVTWTPQAGAAVPAATDAAGQLAAAYSPPAGSYAWEGGYPETLHEFWDGGSPSGELVKGAIMGFEADHGLTPDGTVSPKLWDALLAAEAAGQRNSHGYTYAIASKAAPETLTIWHDGKVVQHSLANTGIGVAPTVDGTFPVYERLRSQIMQGTNPDGSHYADPVQFVAYFNGGDAVHYFPRSSFGFPQSLGCVELSLADAAHAWPYLNYGSLVTVTG